MNFNSLFHFCIELFSSFKKIIGSSRSQLFNLLDLRIGHKQNHCDVTTHWIAWVHRLECAEEGYQLSEDLRSVLLDDWISFSQTQHRAGEISVGRKFKVRKLSKDFHYLTHFSLFSLNFVVSAVSC